jgi:hypothetical protein
MNEKRYDCVVCDKKQVRYPYAVVRGDKVPKCACCRECYEKLVTRKRP